MPTALIAASATDILDAPLIGIITPGKLLAAAVLAAATALISRYVTRAVRHLLNRDSNPLPSTSILVNIARAAIWIASGSVILNSCFGINTNSLVAALGVGGIAVSLGFQDTLSNLIGGLQVTFMGIISPGDNIEVGSESGVVQDITWRHTTIKDALGQTVIVPNSIISKTALVHLLPANRVAVPFSIARYKDEGLAIGGTGSRAQDGSGVETGARDGNVADDGAGNTARDGAGYGRGERDIDELATLIVSEAKKAAGAVSPVVDGPRVFFSEIAELGIKGKVIFKVEDAGATFAAADAVVRAIARSVR